MNETFARAAQLIEQSDALVMVLPPGVTARLAVELGVEQGWTTLRGRSWSTLSLDRFGASAELDVLLEHYGFSVANVVAEARKLLAAD